MAPSRIHPSCVLMASAWFALVACGCASEIAKPAVSPPSPTGECAVSGSEVRLTWEDTVKESGYKIERRKGREGAYEQIATVGENTTTFADGGLEAGVTYYYRIRAYNSAGHSAYTDEICVEVSGD